VSYSAGKRQVAGMNITHNLFGVSAGAALKTTARVAGLDTLRRPRRDSGGNVIAGATPADELLTGPDCPAQT
jgi:hypothetical protein